MPKPYNPNDKWMLKAKSEGFRARSVYKLQELDKEFSLFKKGQTVLDIGAAPGSWLQYVGKKILPNGKALGLDLKKIQFIASNIETKVCDVLDPIQVKEALEGYDQFDLIISDLAPNTSGIKYVDQQRSLDLDKATFETAKLYLKPKGVLLMKIFTGPDMDKFIKELKKHFRKVLISKPTASRDRSKETYIICSYNIIDNR